jgi:hypothetical protein
MIMRLVVIIGIALLALLSLFVLKPATNLNSSLDVIVYECVDQDPESHNICIVNADGIGNRQLITDKAPTEWNSEPKINSKGEIVYICTDRESRGLCLIDLKGSGTPAVIYHRKEGLRSPDINDLGQIAFDCEETQERIVFEKIYADTLPNLCMINRDGTGFREIRSQVYPNQFNWIMAPSINNQGTIAYFCNKDAYDSKLCATQFGQETVLILDDKSSNRLHFSLPPAINQSGQIAYLCGLEVVRACIIASDHFSRLEWAWSYPDLQFNILENPTLNDRGELAISCRNKAAQETWLICVGFVDQREIKILSYPDATLSPIYNAIDDQGRIFSICTAKGSDYSICKINSDGTQFQKFDLTFPPAEGDFFPNLDIP